MESQDFYFPTIRTVTKTKVKSFVKSIENDIAIFLTERKMFILAFRISI